MERCPALIGFFSHVAEGDCMAAGGGTETVHCRCTRKRHDIIHSLIHSGIHRVIHRYSRAPRALWTMTHMRFSSLAIPAQRLPSPRSHSETREARRSEVAMCSISPRIKPQSFYLFADFGADSRPEQHRRRVPLVSRETSGCPATAFFLLPKNPAWSRLQLRGIEG